MTSKVYLSISDKSFMETIKKYFLEKGEGPLFGFFGDHWQNIYRNGCGKIDIPNVEVINKGANFRSCKTIVDCLNRMRPELFQEPNNFTKGFVGVYHTNTWKGDRLVGAQWKGDLPTDVAHQYLEKIKGKLQKKGWDFTPEKTKILMLTHNILAKEQGYQDIAAIFSNTDDYIKKGNDYIRYFADVLEPICIAFKNKKYGEMSSKLNGEIPMIRSHKDKLKWANSMDRLLLLRKEGSVGEIINYLRQTKYPPLSHQIENMEHKMSLLDSMVEDMSESEKKRIEITKKLKSVPYQQVISLINFIEERTPFSTKHGVKGSEYENVLVVIGRGWNLYNFSDMLKYYYEGIPKGKEKMFERNRNLFYVACSRPKKRLAILFTQELSDSALNTLYKWFGKENVQSVEI